jgi:FecR protein/Putative zinc-finger
MLSKHVSRKLSAYCHDELSSDESRLMAEHLIGCPSCRAEFDEVKMGAEAVAQLAWLRAPESLWAGIEQALDHQRLGPRQRNQRVLPFLKVPRFAIAAVVALILLAVVFLFWTSHRSISNPTGPAWNVARVAGSPQIGSIRIGDQGSLGVGQWLETDGISRAKLEVSSIGQIEIDPNTSIRLIETKATEHRLELARGRMSARIFAPPKLFFVNTPSGIAEDLGCAYTLEVDDNGNSLLHVTAGWVSLQLRDRESVVSAGAACATRPGIGPGTPYFEDASELFRLALTKLDFEPNDTQWSKIPALDIALHEARPRDALTLWYLLPRVNEGDRPRVYDRTAELVPPPSGVTRAGVLALNQQMLDRWRETIDGKHERSFGEAFRDELRRIHNGIRRRLH